MAEPTREELLATVEVLRRALEKEMCWISNIAADLAEDCIEPVIAEGQCNATVRRISAALTSPPVEQVRAEWGRLKAENRRARVQVPLWKGVAEAMVRRASRVRCQFGGCHSVADCNCDPRQTGDAGASMQAEFDRAEAAGDIKAQLAAETARADKAEAEVARLNQCCEELKRRTFPPVIDDGKVLRAECDEDGNYV